MQVDIVTLFPQFVRPVVDGSILGRAQVRNFVNIDVHDLWRFVPSGERADDAPYGGGPGMVMRLGPIVSCLEQLLGGGLSVPSGTRVVVPAPSGRRFDQSIARAISALERLIVICGRYEGIDQRLFELVSAEEISIGDFVVTGGELPALVIVDAAVRLIPGVLSPGSAEEESFSSGLLDWPHYTRPAVFRDKTVPEILLTGDHERVAQWRRDEARKRTAALRPDLSRSGESPKG
jgi:tRNA (guanine37-N1)-methyltransferase